MADLGRLAGPGIDIVGQVPDLAAEVFDKVRPTVAPLRYGGRDGKGPGMAALICRLHRDGQFNRATADAGKVMIRERFTRGATASALRNAIDGRRENCPEFPERR